MNALLIADLILVTHTLFVAIVVGLVPLILMGAWLKWQWVYNRWIRGSHIAAILFVVINTWFGILCPLTIWENELRQSAGQSGYGESFIAYWFGQILFYDFPSWVFTCVYTLFATLVIALFWIAPVKWKLQQN